jgi:hypothetical protein
MMALGMDKRYFERHRFPKWNIQPTVLQEPRLMARVFPELTKGDHERLAYKFRNKAKEADIVYQAALDTAIKKHGERRGALISGIYSEHFPVSVKTELRALAPLKGIYADAALAHWQAAGKRSRLF